MKEIIFEPIGVISTPYSKLEAIPIQSKLADDTVTGMATLFPEFADGLKDLYGFSHCYLIYHFHKAGKCELRQKPFLDSEPKGIFAIRHFNRPNPIGISVVKILQIEKNVIMFTHVDILDRTPLLDIKPYVPDFDIWPEAQKGWTEGKVNNREKNKR